MIYVKAANFDDIEKEWKFTCDIPADENGFLNDWAGISREDFENKALPDMLRFSRGENLPDWMVPETYLFLWDDEGGEPKIVGQFRLRHCLNEALKTGGGHIGQFIAKEYRGKGYGTKGLALTLEYARTIVPEDEFYLRVNKDNPASLKVMQKNGGYIAGEDDGHFYVRIKK